jgi:hypothetical protein
MALRRETLSDGSPNALASPGHNVGAVNHNGGQSVSAAGVGNVDGVLTGEDLRLGVIEADHVRLRVTSRAVAGPAMSVEIDLLDDHQGDAR